MTRRLIALVCATVVASLSSAAQRGTDETAEISGTVMTTTGVPPAPLARVLVTISGDSLKTSRTTITDDHGQFVFRDLPAGRMTIVAARPAYVKTAYGAKRPGRPGTPINLSAGQRVSDLTIRLAPGAAITGLVRHPDGEPAAGIQIVAKPLGVRVDPAVAPAVTDDRGVYRLFGLPPGRYIVAASVEPGRGNAGFGQLSDAEMDEILANLQRRSRLGVTSGVSVPGAKPPANRAQAASSTRSAKYSYAPIYYPGTPDADQADALTLAEGDERTAVDFDLQRVRTPTIEGRVSITGDTLPSGIQITLTHLGVRGQASDALISLARLDSSGGFTFPNVLPGRYRVLARATNLTPAATTPTAKRPSVSQPATYRVADMYWALADITVGDEDLTDLALTLQPGLTLTGRFVFNAHTLKPPDTVQLRMTDLDGAAAFSRFGGGRADGPFEISGLLPGTYTMTSPLSDSGWWLRSVVIGGRDVLDFPLEVGTAGDVGGAVATFTDQHTQLSGTLKSAANIPAPEYFVVVFSSDRTFWRPASRRVQFTRPSMDGRFSLSDLPAGDYLIAALTDMEASDLTDVSFMERLVPAALSVHLDDGEKKVQDLKVLK